MRVAKGLTVIAKDQNLGDVYYGELLNDWDTCDKRNPAVRVTQMLHYPIQTAIMSPTCANDNAPLEEGKAYLLKVTEVCNPDHIPKMTFVESVDKARDRAIVEALECGRNDVYDILMRHQNGEITKPREAYIKG